MITRGPLIKKAAAAFVLLAIAPATALEAQESPDTTRHPGAHPAAPGAPEGAAEPEPLELDVRDAVRRAVTANEDVLIERAERARTAGIVKEVRSRSLPDISAGFDYTRNLQTPVIFFNTPEGVEQITVGDDNELAFSLNLNQTLFDPSLGPARAAARLSRDATAAAVEAARTSTALETRVAYYDALLSRALVGVQEQALMQAEDRLEQVRSFFEAGTVSEFDLLTAQVEAANLRPPLIEARNDLALDRDALKRTMGLALDREIVLTDSFPAPASADSLPPSAASSGDRESLLPSGRSPAEPSPGQESLERLLERARQERSDLRAQRTRVRLQEENVSVENRSALPVLELSASLVRSAASSDVFPGARDFTQSTGASIGFNLPLFDGNSRSGLIQQAAAARDREGYRLRQLEESAELEVRRAWRQREAAREQISASVSNVERAERALEIARTRFSSGLSPQIEVTEAELSLTEARTNYARARHAYAVAGANLAAATGER